MEIIKTKKDFFFMLVFVSFMVFGLWGTEKGWDYQEYAPTRLTPEQEYDLKVCSKDGFSDRQIGDCFFERSEKRRQEEEQRGDEQQRDEENL